MTLSRHNGRPTAATLERDYLAALDTLARCWEAALTAEAWSREQASIDAAMGEALAAALGKAGKT
jgi:hypothetical protein